MDRIIATDKQNPPNAAQTIVQAWPMLRSLVGLGVICAALIAIAYLMTLPTIQQKQAEHLEAAIFQVLPGATIKKEFTFSADNRFVLSTTAAGEKPVFAGYNGNNEFIGVAIAAQGMGYQDTIRVLYGYNPATNSIVGLQILASKETPGLGDKIEKAAHFIKNFTHLDVQLNANASKLANAIEWVKQSTKHHPWQVDGISGATISSKAVARILDISAQEWIVKIKNHVNDFDINPKKNQQEKQVKDSL